MKPLKALMVGIIGLLAVGCASTPTMESVAGTYEGKAKGDVNRLVLLPNGVAEAYENGKEDQPDVKWKIKDSEMHITFGKPIPHTGIMKINSNGSLTVIAAIANGKRIAAPKEHQYNLKKIK